MTRIDLDDLEQAGTFESEDSMCGGSEYVLGSEFVIHRATVAALVRAVRATVERDAARHVSADAWNQVRGFGIGDARTAGARAADDAYRAAAAEYTAALAPFRDAP